MYFCDIRSYGIVDDRNVTVSSAAKEVILSHMITFLNDKVFPLFCNVLRVRSMDEYAYSLHTLFVGQYVVLYLNGDKP